jgi:hypothetical protein
VSNAEKRKREREREREKGAESARRRSDRARTAEQEREKRKRERREREREGEGEQSDRDGGSPKYPLLESRAYVARRIERAKRAGTCVARRLSNLAEATRSRIASDSAKAWTM